MVPCSTFSQRNVVCLKTVYHSPHPSTFMSFSYSSLRRRHRAVFVTLLVLLLTLAFRVLASAPFIEQYYSRGFFPAFRWLWGLLTYWAPIPLFIVFWGVVLHRSNVLLRLAVSKSSSSQGKWSLVAQRIFLFWSWVIIAFFWMWGFNYSRQPVTETLIVPPSDLQQSAITGFDTYSMTLDELRNRVYTEAAALAELRRQVSPDTAFLDRQHFPENLVAAVQPLLVAALNKHGYPSGGSVRLRQLWPPGILLRWSTSGVYWPWAGEGNIDRGLWHLSKPAVIAHELAHAYGFGDEGTCSFFAYLAGLEAASPALQYAFRLDYWQRIASRLRRADPAGYAAFRDQQLAPGIINDLNAIYRNNEQYPDFLPAVRNATYNTYLKAQGIEEGMLNYGTVVRLVEGYRLAAR